MSIVTVHSNNENLSYVLAKNPATIRDFKKPFSRELRKGRIYGWFVNEQNTKFRLMFIDSPVETSFTEDRSEFEYLDKTRYSSPYIPIMMITTALKTASTDDSDKDTVPASVDFTIEVTTNILSKFHNMGIVTDYQPVSGRHFNVTVLGKNVKEALNNAMLVCVIACFADENTYVRLDSSGLTKYLNILNRANAPYYIRHLFLSRAFSNKETFDKLDNVIQTPGMKLQYGNTQVQRLTAVKEQFKDVPEGATLVDIGCGEMYASTRLCSKFTGGVIAIDADEELMATNERKIKNKELPISALLQEVTPEWVRDTGAGLVEGSYVLMGEFVEHVPKKQSIAIVNEILKANPEKVVITVPNRAFNKYYYLTSDQFRHLDHKWEPTALEFAEFLLDAKKGIEGYAVFVEPVGDEVTEHDETESVSLMGIFKKVKKA